MQALAIVIAFDLVNDIQASLRSRFVADLVDSLDFQGLEKARHRALSHALARRLIVNTLPNEKKFGVVREAKKENVTRESEREAERGIWEAIKEFAGKAYEVYKENKETIHTIVAAIWSIFAKKK